MVTKAQMVKAIQDLPEDASVAEAIERLSLLEKIDQEIAQADADQTVPRDEALRRLSAWHIDAIETGIAEADAGAPSVSHERVATWMRSWGTEHEQPRPE